jgi:hypothetical protein
VVPTPVHPLHATSSVEQRKSKLPRVSSGHRGETGALPIGVLLAADGAVRGNTTATLTPPGGVRYPSAWEQESAPPLPRREPRVTARPAGANETHGLPRRRDLRTPPSRRDHGTGPIAPRSPQANSIARPQFPSTLPPGVVRLDEPAPPTTGSPAAKRPVTDDETRAIVGRHDRPVLRDDSTRLLHRTPRRTIAGPATGSLDIDADLFTPASERLARQTPSGGISARHTPPDGVIAARHTPSAGLSLGHLRALAEAPAAPVTPANGVYPRRRDLRRQGGPTVAAMPPQAPAGLAFVPSQSSVAPCSGEIPLGTAMPRRRDLRHGTAPAATTAGTADVPERTATERTGAIAVGVARAAVMTMLVGVGYAVVSGHQLSLDLTPDASGTTDAPVGAMMSTGSGNGGSQARARVSEWDARGEVDAVKAAADKQTRVRVEAAKAAQARVQAAKAAAAARAARLAQATRDAQRNPKAVAKLLAAQRGWGNTQFTCLDLLWTRESGWNYRATNASSGAYGIPQSLPGGKMSSIAPDWRTNPVTQIKWGLNYIADRYGTPCGAWSHSQATGWY